MAEPQSLLKLKAELQVKRAPLYASLIKWAWRGIYWGVAGVVALFLFINFTAIPSFRELEDPHSALASEVLAVNGELLGRYYIENRVPVSFEELSPHLVNALIATEDERFKQHCGIDPQAVGRVIFRTILLADQSGGGGSTITQQLAKMLYSDRNFEGMSGPRKFITLVYKKLREWITAVKLEKSYTKEEIIAMYLNQFNFVNNAYGIRAAAEIYFGKSQNDLTVEEAAMLIGMLQNPSLYNPVRYPEKCIKRRAVVMYQMMRNGYLSEEQYDRLKVKPLDMSRFKRVSFTDDKAPYLCAELKKDLAKILDQPECRRADGEKYNIYKDGLRITTTIDPVYQRYAEEAVQEHLRKIQKRFFEVWKGRDPWTYKIKDSDGETTDEEIQQRKDKLFQIVREGDRYQALRPKYLGTLAEKVLDEYKIELRDADIERMLAEERKAGAITRLVAKKFATPEQAAAYRRIMASPDWLEIKKQWRNLNAAVKKQYDTKVPMKVFSWNSKLEKDTFMSPLDSLKYHRMFLQTGFLAVDPSTSQVKAWVGGANFKYFQFDHTRTSRQVGSTFKPLVYATAIAQQGISPCFTVYDLPVTIPKNYQNFRTSADWTPKNSTGNYSGRLLTLKEALKNSVNSVSAYLMKQMGDTEPVRGLAHNMGIDSTIKRPDGEYRLPKQPSICLGAADLSVFEMTAAYATFANNGVYSRPTVILKIEDKNGKVIYRAQGEERIALPPNANYVMLEMLKYNVKGAPGISSLKTEIGGKTGTTNDYSDGWFMGVTPKLVVGTWVGGEDRWVRFLSLDDGQGARMARPIVAGFFGKLEKDKNSGFDPNAHFTQPPGDLGIEINCASYRDSTATDEEFYEDIYNDELPADQPAAPGQKPPAKKPSDSFGDELEDDGFR
ncbi:MAG: transglycosylase domain-containing protein [Saprospiraceae bacterium]